MNEIELRIAPASAPTPDDAQPVSATLSPVNTPSGVEFRPVDNTPYVSPHRTDREHDEQGHARGNRVVIDLSWRNDDNWVDS